MDSITWQEAVSRRIGRAIDKARGKHSDQWLADRTEELGHPISRMTISEYRRGVRKTVSITDLMVIAAALEVPPITLIFQDLPNGPISLLPDREAVALDGLLWFTGERHSLPEGVGILLSLDDGHPMGAKLPVEYTHPEEKDQTNKPSHQQELLDLCRELVGAHERFYSLTNELWQALENEGHTHSQLTKRMLEAEDRRFADIRKQIETLGGNLDEPPVEQWEPDTDD